jgi:hypothetical protein
MPPCHSKVRIFTCTCMCYSVHFHLLIKVSVYVFVCVCVCVYTSRVKGYARVTLQLHEHPLPGVIIVPITIGSRNSVTIHGSGKYAGFVMVISDPP